MGICTLSNRIASFCMRTISASNIGFAVQRKAFCMATISRSNDFAQIILIHSAT